MADISLVIDVKQNGVTSAVKNTKALERNVKLLSDSFKGGGLSQRQYYKGLLELARASGKSEKELRKYANELRRAERASAAAAAQARLEAQARRDAAAAARVAAAAQRAATQAAAEAARAARTQADANRRLRMEFREGYAAQVALRAAQMRLNQARRQGIVTEEEYQRQLARLNEINRGNVRGTNNLGVAMQQTGYQVGDFLVQIQSGTNPMVAFGQQATQLVGVLYLLPPAMLAASRSIMGFSVSVGFLIASLSIIIPFATAIGAYFMRMKEASDASAKATEKLDEKIKALKNSLVDYADAQEALTSGVSLDEYFSIKNFEKATDELKRAKEDLEDLTISEGLVGGVLGAIPFIGDTTGVQAELDAYNAALEKVIDAEKVLADLRKKEADERFKNFDRSRVELEEELAMAQEIARFGKDSAQVAKLELEQRITAFNRNIDQQVASNNLSAIHARTLKSINAEIANTESATEEVNRNQDLIKSGAEVLNTVWSNLKAIVSDAADDAGRFADNLVLGQGYLDAAVRSGVASGAIPPQALQDLPQTDAQKAMERILDQRRRDARRPERPSRQGSGGTTQEDPIAAFEKQLALEEKLIGKTEARKRVIQALGIEFTEQNVAATSKYEADINRITELNRLEEQRQSIIGKVESSMESAFMSMVDGTKSVKDAFRSMAAEIIKELYRIYVIKRITGMVAGAFGGGSAGMTAAPVVNPMAGMSGSQMLPQAMGGAWMKGVQMFANGGVVDSPTMFGHSGGVGVMGEAGPEAIMPLKRGANGKLGVSVEGGSGAVNVTNNINVTGGSDPAAIRMEVAKLMPQITSATKSAVIDARRRGGQMKAAFG